LALQVGDDTGYPFSTDLAPCPDFESLVFTATPDSLPIVAMPLISPSKYHPSHRQLIHYNHKKSPSDEELSDAIT
jgi:hypothetical protein